MATTAKRSFGPDRGSLSSCRVFVRERLASWHAEEFTEDAQLLTSELAANVILHAATPIGLELALSGETLRVEVSDGSSVLPAVADLARTDGGNGLRLVESIATSWGVDARDDGGKVVWFTLRRNAHR